MSTDDYLRASMANTLRPFLPPLTQWFDRTEEARVWMSVFRVYRVPYNTQEITATLAEFGQVRAVFANVNLPYPEMAFGLKPTPEGEVEPGGGLVGWQATNRGVLLMLMTPLMSDRQSVDPETAASLRIDSARAVIVGIMGLNAAFERICEFSIDYKDSSRTSISRTSQAMENPQFHRIPDIHDQTSFELVKSILESVDSLEEPKQDRVRLALRWYQRALGERRILRMGGGNVDSLINYWIALETLVRVGEQKVAGALIRELSTIHNISRQQTGQIFPISKIYERRKEIIHRGLMLGASFELQQFLSDIFIDILVIRVMELSVEPKTQRYLDGDAYSYL